jgi:hypothetical protein
MMKITTLFIVETRRYTTSMSIFVKSTEAKKPKLESSKWAALLLAGILIVMLVGQLFTFEKFPAVLQGLGFFSSEGGSRIAAALIVIFELAALPFLLRMRLSPFARVSSMCAGWLVLLYWFVTAICLNASLNISDNSGVLGGTVAIPVGAWMITFFMALGVLHGWASYGMWPLARSSKKWLL